MTSLVLSRGSVPYGIPDLGTGTLYLKESLTVGSVLCAT